jgi:hypothetical protein
MTQVLSPCQLTLVVKESIKVLVSMLRFEG